MRWNVAFVMLAGLSACASKPSHEAESSRPELPVTAVSIYAGGAAYVECKGTVHGDATIDVNVKGSQLAGVLRSMAVADEGGRATVMVKSAESGGKSPAASRVDLGHNPTMVELLQQLRGAKVKLTSGSNTQEVTIVSLEKKEKGDGWMLNVLDNGAIRSMGMDSVSKIELPEGSAQRELAKAMEGLWPMEEQRPRTIAVHLAGKGERTVRMAYMLESEPWKASYRLTLSEKPALQGWATVSNDTGNEWKKVELRLMGGAPVVLGTGTDSAAVERAAKGAGVPAGELLRRPKPVLSREALDSGPDAADPAPSAAAGADLPPIDARQAFRHSVAGVSAPRGCTVAVPIFGEPVTVERVAVYNESLLRRNPLQGVRLRNTTSRFLAAGPVTVVDEDQYAGEGTMEPIAPGRACLVRWGIDLAVQVDATGETYATAIKSAKIDKGVLRVVRAHTYAKRYAAENEDQKDRTLIVEHAFRRGWRLVEPAEAMEMTETLCRFKLAVPAGKRAALTVKEQSLEAEGIDLLTAEAGTVRSYAREAEVASDVRDALAKAAGLRQAVEEQERIAQEKQAEAERLSASGGDDARGKEQAAEATKAAGEAKKNGEKARKELEDYVGKLSAGK